MELEDRYGQPSGIRVYQVKKELASISQGSMNIPEYYARMKYIWDELSVLNVYSDSHCTCGGGKLDIQKREEDQKVYQFLMGLNEGYANAIRNLLMMSPFSTINKTYSLLVTDERQREIQPHSSQFSSESASFSAGSQRSFQKPFQKNFQPKTSFDSRRPSVVCSYCNKPDHTAERCYRKHGFPPNFQFTRNNRRIAANVQTELDPSKQFAHVEPKPFTETPPANVADTSTIPGLTNVQCSQLLTLLQQHHVSDPNSTSHFTASANFAGILSLFSSNRPKCSVSNCLLCKVDKNSWILDSRATDHMTSHSSLLHNIKSLLIPYLVTMPNGYKVKVTCVGDLTLSNNTTLSHVLLVPSFQYNLIYVHKLVSQLKCLLIFSSFACFIQGLSMKRPLEFGKFQHGLYILQLPSFNSSCPSTVVSYPSAFTCSHSSTLPDLGKNNVECSVTSVPFVNISPMNKMNTLWHSRLGHIPFVHLKSIPSISSMLSSK